jgi:hypothetical protein
VPERLDLRVRHRRMPPHPTQSCGPRTGPGWSHASPPPRSRRLDHSPSCARAISPARNRKVECPLFPSSIALRLQLFRNV